MPKRTVNFAFIFIFFSICLSCQNGDKKRSRQIDIFSITDGGKTYSDTFLTENGRNEINPISSVESGIPKKLADTSSVKVNSSYYHSCSLSRKGNDVVFSLALNTPSAEFPFSIELKHITGSLNDSGILWITQKEISKSAHAIGDSNSSNKLNEQFMGSVFVEHFKGDMVYSIDSLSINFEKADSLKVKGKYQLWLANKDAKKKILGTFDCNTK